MTYTEINEMMSEAVKNYKDYGKHELLVNLSCVYEDNSESVEVIFAVPEEWLLDYMTNLTKTMWSWLSIHDWLENEYTSEDSQQILEKAILENEIAFYVVR
jgi:hypothetical protein